MTPLALADAVAPTRASADIDITTAVDPAQWDAFVREHEAGSVYHLWGWRRVFENAFGLETVYLAARRAGAMAGILPLAIFRSRVFGRFAVSLPFVDAGGVCARDAAVAQALLAHAREVAQRQRLSHLELRHVTRQFPELPARAHKVDMRLGLAPTAEQAWTALDRKVRNQIRKAGKSTLAARSGGAELLDAFYPVFAHNMRDLGTPVWTSRFFSETVAALAPRARVFLVEHEGTPVAGAVALLDQRVMTVPWASSLRAYRPQCPNYLLYWRMVEAAIASGATTFDFGRSTPGEGTYHFKEQWGAIPTSLHWEYVLLGQARLPMLHPANPKFRLAINAWKRLPLPLTRWLGPRIARSIP